MNANHPTIQPQHMRVMQVMAGAAKGGAEMAFVDTCIALHEAGLNQLIVTRANPLYVERLRKAGLRVTTLPFGGKMDLYTPWRIAQLAREFQPDIVQTWMSRAAQRLPKRPKDCHYQVISRLGGYYRLKHFPQTDYFMTITPAIADFLVKSGVAPARIRHINNFAETENVATPVSRATLNTPENAKVALCLSRLHTSKALDVAIKAIAPLPDMHLWLAGEGPEERELKQLTSKLGLENRVHFLGWRTDRAALLKAADMCLFISRYEPFGTVFVQAWSQQIPVIVSNSDGPAQFVRDDEDALMVPIDNVGALTHAMQRLSDQKLAETLVQNGYARYRNEFTREKTLQAYFSYFSDVISAAQPQEPAAQVSAA